MTNLFKIMFFLMIVSCSGQPQKLFQEGQNLIRSNPEQAKQHFESSCLMSYWPSCSALGAIYEQKGMTVESETFYSKSCDNSEAFGCYGLASLATKKGNHREARNKMIKACLLGFKHACTIIDGLNSQKE